MASNSDTQSAPKPSLSFGRSSVLIIEVGNEDNKVAFFVTKGMVCGRSKFFERALDGKWMEADGVVSLPDDDPRIFKLWLIHVYTNEIDILAGDRIQEIENPLQSAEVSDAHRDLCMLYVLSEKLCDRTARNAIVRRIYTITIPRSNSRFGLLCPAYTKMVYDGTLDNNPLRRLIIDESLWIGIEAFSAGFDGLPKEFYRDYAVALQKGNQVGTVLDYMERDE